jgi:hypothetical protein
MLRIEAKVINAGRCGVAVPAQFVVADTALCDVVPDPR